MMKDTLQSKVEELQIEHNRICNALAEMKDSYDRLNTRRIELEGAMKAIFEIINTNQEVAEKNDSESKTPQRTDTN